MYTIIIEQTNCQNSKTEEKRNLNTFDFEYAICFCLIVWIKAMYIWKLIQERFLFSIKYAVKLQRYLTLIKMPNVKPRTSKEWKYFKLNFLSIIISSRTENVMRKCILFSYYSFIQFPIGCMVRMYWVTS